MPHHGELQPNCNLKVQSAPVFAGYAARFPRPGAGRGSDAAFIIAHAAGGDGLGTIGLHLFDDDAGLATVGYWLRREARGHGAATIAVRLISGWAFDQLGIKLVTAWNRWSCDPSRKATLRPSTYPGPYDQLQ